MAGTMSEKELTISCGMKPRVKVESLSGNTNAAAMALTKDTVYLAKAHANENGKMVYKSMILKLDKSALESTDSIGKNDKVAEINYFVYGMTATEERLYCTCKNEAGESGILEMKTDASGQKFTKLDTTYVGIDTYKDGKFILMETLGRKSSETMNFITGSLEELKNKTGIKFTVIANDAEKYQKANGIHYDKNQGLFILTNYYPDDSRKYEDCKNRILLVKPGTYVSSGKYYPHAVFQADQDATVYSQFNLEGIILYKNNMWVLSNAVKPDDKNENDCISCIAGITFKKWNESVDEEGNGYFSFNGSTKTGASLPDYAVSGTKCTSVESMAIDESGKAYCLKCDPDNKYAVLLTTDNPEKEGEKAVKRKTYQDDECLYHCNGMTYNPDDKKLYVCGYDKLNPTGIKKKIFAIDKNGEFTDKDCYDSVKAQYGIALYKTEAGRYEFLLMNQKSYKEKSNADNTIPFDIALLENGNLNVDEKKFNLDFGRKNGETLQDIFYHAKYGMLFPVTVSDGIKSKTTIYHVSKEQIAEAITKGGIVKPDFAIVLDKSSKYETYEIESMDISPDTKQMVMCGNFKSETASDAFETLKTLTFA